MHFIQQMTTEYVQNIERQKQDEFKRFAKKKEIVKNTISEWYRKVYYFTFFNGRSSLPGLIK